MEVINYPTAEVMLLIRMYDGHEMHFYIFKAPASMSNTNDNLMSQELMSELKHWAIANVGHDAMCSIRYTYLEFQPRVIDLFDWLTYNPATHDFSIHYAIL